MLTAVIAEPLFQAPDWAWIEEIRRRHDPRHGMVGPHVTLVFPAPCADPEAVLRQVAVVAGRHAAFSARLRIALPVRDHRRPGAHVYLVPDEGLSRFVRLHDELYAGELAGGLDLDAPYIPHVTVAAFADIGAAKALADRLNAAGFDITGQVDAVTVLRCDLPGFQTLGRIDLVGAGAV